MHNEYPQVEHDPAWLRDFPAWEQQGRWRLLVQLQAGGLEGQMEWNEVAQLHLNARYLIQGEQEPCDAVTRLSLLGCIFAQSGTGW